MSSQGERKPVLPGVGVSSVARAVARVAESSKWDAEKLAQAERDPMVAVEHVLDKPEFRRDDADVALLQLVLKDVAFFQKLKPTLREQLFRVGKVDRVPSNAVVFREGEVGDRFYVLLTGRVAIYIPINDEEREQKRLERVRLPSWRRPPIPLFR